MKKEIEIQQENIEELMKLTTENPELEIIPMVSSDVIASDDYNYWKGKWSKACIDHIYCSNERIYFKSEDYEELVEDFLNDYLERTEEWAKKQVDNLPWEKVITVSITEP